MTLRMPVKPGKQLSMLLAPKDGCIYFENLSGNLPVCFQAYINDTEHRFFICRCTLRARNAGKLDPAGDGKTFKLEDRALLKLLSGLVGPEQRFPCRIRGKEKPFRGGSGFLFDLKSAETPEPALDN